jgi:hypothetical protein
VLTVRKFKSLQTGVMRKLAGAVGMLAYHPNAAKTVSAVHDPVQA